MNLLLPFEFISTLGAVLIAAVFTVFTFAVTLLGKVIQFAKEEESRAQAERTQSFQERISDLQNRLDEAKKRGDSKNLESELADLIEERKSYEETISSIKNKYSYLNFHEAVVHPALFFILSILLAQIGNGLYRVNTIDIYAPLLFLIASVSLFIGMYRLSRSLLLIQEVSSKTNKETAFEPEKLTQMIKGVLVEYEEELKKKTSEKLTLKFTNQIPLNYKVSEEFELKFKVSLSQGKIMKGVEVWFFVPDVIILISPPEEESWRQEPNYDLPNKKTIKVSIGDISIGPYHSGKLKIKAPAIPGTYPLYYRLYGEGYQEDMQKIEILFS